MKKILTINLILSFMILFFSCAEKPKNPFIPSDVTPSTYGQQTAIVDSNGENNVAFFDFSTGTITHIKHNVWDIAFSTSDLSLMIANSGSYGIGVKVTNTESTDWDADYSGKAGNINKRTETNDNPLKDWRNGTTKKYVYLAEDEEGNTYKFQVDSIAGNTYKLKIDTLDGTSTTTIDVTINLAYDYIYVDLGTKKVVSFAPPLADWDIKFGQTEVWVQMGPSFGMWCGLSSISENIAGLIESCLVKKNIEDVTSASGLTLSANLIIATGVGSWYEFIDPDDHSAGVKVILEQTYVVQTVEGNYAKFQMLTYDGPNGESFYSVFKYYYQDGGSPDFSH